MRKTAFEIVSAVLEELEKLKPTQQEIQDYVDLNQDAHGVVTYSKSKGGELLLPQIARYIA
jgi:AMMECR1 domain-containing protein